MRRSVALPIGIVVAFLIVALLATQLILPPLAARQIEHRLTKDGGSAHVSLHAFPALRLLFKHGDSIDVTGDGLSVQLGTGRQHVLDKLDGFGSAHIHLTNVRAGPFDTKSFTLDHEIWAGDRRVAAAKSVLVGYDYDMGASVALTENQRRRLAA